MTDLKVPPQQDFHDYAGLVGDQGDNFGTLKTWCSTECAKTDGLDGGLLAPLLEVVPKVSSFLAGKLAHCEKGMGTIVRKVNETGSAYAHTEHATTVNLQSLYGAPLAHFPDIGAVKGLPRAGSFRHDDLDGLKKPEHGAGYITARNITHELWLLGNSFAAKEMRAANAFFKHLTGHGLFDLLMRPLTGEYGQLLYLHDVYDKLGDGTYTVTGYLRKGSWAVADEWTGETARAFDSYMFRWTMGTGGIGDAAKVAAKVFKDGYDIICGLVFIALRDIRNLIESELRELGKEAIRLIGGDVAIEAVGGGPEDPFADIGAAIFSGWELYKMYRRVRRIITVIHAIQATFDKIGAAVKKIEKDVGAVRKFVNEPPTIGSLIDDVEQRGFEFEKSGAWDPTLGTARIAMLPPA